MKTNFIKYSILAAIALTGFTSCVKEDDFALPEYKDKVTVTSDNPYIENFESHANGSGSNEVAVSGGGWFNVNIASGNRLWNVRQFSNNKFAEFSSFYSNNSHLDETWLVTPKVELLDESYSFSFDSQVRFYTNDNLSVYISDDFNGTVEGLQSATWTPLDVFISSAAEDGNNTFTTSGVVNLDAYKNSVVRIAFKYIGNKAAGETSTYQIDNITIFEN